MEGDSQCSAQSKASSIGRLIIILSGLGFALLMLFILQANVASAADPAAPVPPTPAPVGVEHPALEHELLLGLRNGFSRRMLSGGDQVIKIKTSFGDTELKLQQINKITFNEEKRKYLFQLQDGSKISGAVADKTILILNKSGKKESIAWETIASLTRVAPDLELLAALKEIDRLKFVNELAVDEEKYPEAKMVLAGAVKRDHALRKKARKNAGRDPGHPALLKDVKKVELLKVFDPTKEPMRKHAGEPKKVPGAYAPKALVGTTGGIMIWGPYVGLPKGRYIAIYRVQFTQKPNGGNVCNLDVCQQANTWKGIGPNANELKGAGEWNELPVPFDAPGPMVFEFRFWPHNRPIAHDRIYVFKLE